MLLTEEQRAIRDAPRGRSPRPEIAPHAAAWERDGGAPRDLYRRMGEIGLMGVCVPSEHGGAGADFVSYALAMEEIAAADCGVANMMAANNSRSRPRSRSTVRRPRRRPGSRSSLGEAHRGHPPDRAPDRLGRGRDPHACARRAGGDGWTIDGSKAFVTGGSTADVAMIVAVTDPAAGKRGITCFLCPTDRPGYRVVRQESKLGHRTNDTCQIALDGLEAADDDVLGEPGAGLGIASATSRRGASGWRPRPWAPRGPPSRRRAITRASARRSASPSSSTRPSRSDLPRWRRRWKWHARCTSTRRLSKRPERTPSARLPWRSSSRLRCRASMLGGRSRSTADTAISATSRSRSSIVDARVLQIYEGTSEVQKIVIGRML